MTGSWKEAMLGTHFIMHLINIEYFKKRKEGKPHGKPLLPQNTMLKRKTIAMQLCPSPQCGLPESGISTR